MLSSKKMSDVLELFWGNDDELDAASSSVPTTTTTHQDESNVSHRVATSSERTGLMFNQTQSKRKLPSDGDGVSSWSSRNFLEGKSASSRNINLVENDSLSEFITLSSNINNGNIKTRNIPMKKISNSQEAVHKLLFSKNKDDTSESEEESSESDESEEETIGNFVQNNVNNNNLNSTTRVSTISLKSRESKSESHSPNDESNEEYHQQAKNTSENFRDALHHARRLHDEEHRNEVIQHDETISTALRNDDTNATEENNHVKKNNNSLQQKHDKPPNNKTSKEVHTSSSSRNFRSTRNTLHLLPTACHEVFPVNDFIMEQQLPTSSHPLEKSYHDKANTLKFTAITHLTRVKRALDINKSCIHHRTNQFRATCFPLTASTISTLPKHHSLRSLYKGKPLCYYHLLDSFKYADIAWLVHVTGAKMHKLCVTCIEIDLNSSYKKKLIEMGSQFFYSPEQENIDTQSLPTILQLTCRSSKSPTSTATTINASQFIACRYSDNSIRIFEFSSTLRNGLGIKLVETLHFTTQTSNIVHIAWQHASKWDIFQLSILFSDNTLKFWNSKRGLMDMSHSLDSKIPSLPLGGIFHSTICEFTSNPMELFIIGNTGIYIYDIREKKSRLLLEMAGITAFARNYDHPYMYAISTQKRVLIYDERMGSQELVCFNLSPEHDGLSEMFFYSHSENELLLVGYKYQRGIICFPIEPSSILMSQKDKPLKAELPWDDLEKIFATKCRGSGIPTPLDTFHDATLLISPNLKLLESTPHFLVGCTIIPPSNTYPFLKVFHTSDGGDVFCQNVYVNTTQVSFKGSRNYEKKNSSLVKAGTAFEKLFKWNRKGYPSIFESNAYCDLYSLLAFNRPTGEDLSENVNIASLESNPSVLTVDASKLVKIMTTDTTQSYNISNGFGAEKIPTPEEINFIVNNLRNKYKNCHQFLVFPLINVHRELIEEHFYSFSLSLKTLDTILTSSKCFHRWKIGDDPKVYSDIYFALTDEEEKRIKGEITRSKQSRQEASQNILDILFAGQDDTSDNEKKQTQLFKKTNKTQKDAPSFSQQSVHYSQNNDDEEVDNESSGDVDDEVIEEEESTEKNDTSATTSKGLGESNDAQDIVDFLLGEENDDDDDNDDELAFTTNGNAMPTEDSSDDEEQEVVFRSIPSNPNLDNIKQLRKDFQLDGPFQRDEKNEIRYENITVNMDLFRSDLAKWYNSNI